MIQEIHTMLARCDNCNALEIYTRLSTSHNVILPRGWEHSSRSEKDLCPQCLEWENQLIERLKK